MPDNWLFEDLRGPSASEPAASSSATAASSTGSTGVSTGFVNRRGAWLQRPGQVVRRYTSNIFERCDVAYGEWAPGEIYPIENLRAQEVPQAIATLGAARPGSSEKFTTTGTSGERLEVGIRAEKKSGKNKTGKKVVLVRNGGQILQQGIPDPSNREDYFRRMVSIAEEFARGDVTLTGLKDLRNKTFAG